jgi:hypothetical protein
MEIEFELVLGQNVDGRVNLLETGGRPCLRFWNPEGSGQVGSERVSVLRPAGIEGGTVTETGFEREAGLKDQVRGFDPVGSSDGWKLGSLNFRVELDVDGQNLLPVGEGEFPGLGMSLLDGMPTDDFEKVPSTAVLLQEDDRLTIRSWRDLVGEAGIDNQEKESQEGEPSPESSPPRP